jgi:hypothetical protein
MNILWIEDFGGQLDSGVKTLTLMFQNLLSFDNLDKDILNLIDYPNQLAEFCQQQASVHGIYLCRNYFDYVEFKNNHAIVNKIDAIILDIRLDSGDHVDFDLTIPEPYKITAEFHKNAGFYIFNDLVHLGVPAEKMCFMTGEDSTFGDFKTKCLEIYVPQIECFEKRDTKGYDKLRTWLTKQETPYVKLRRGIIEACQYLKGLSISSKENLLFNKFIEKKKIEISEIHDYLGILESFLPLREPSDKAALYKLFIRTLSHEWEAAEPKLINKADKISGQYAFASIMKIARNWIAHSNIFNNVNEQDVAFLFICNMRAMFELSNDAVIYETNLLALFSKPLEASDFNKKIGKTQQDRNLPLSDYYILLLEEAGKLLYGTKTWETDFYNVLKNLQNDKANKKNGDFFIEKLYQCFWFLTSNGYIYTPKMEYQFSHFKYGQTKFLLEFSRRIYKRSF